ncbi:MAG TPA: AAA family ATPase [Acidimicrobiales bacterium]|nr:AAA family ATPase [Acidimicrobiales bacterium]
MHEQRATPPDRFRNARSRSRRNPLAIPRWGRRRGVDAPARTVQRRPAPGGRLRQALVAATVVVIVVAVAVPLLLRGDDPALEQVTTSELLAQAERGEVAAVTIDDMARIAEITYLGDDEPSAIAGYPSSFGGDLTTGLDALGVDVDAVPYAAPTRVTDLLLSLVPVVLILAFLALFLRSKGGLGVGRMNRKRSSAVEVPDVRFSDVAGLDEVVDELREVAEMLHDPERFAGTGARTPRGFLLEGAPGTGKTLLARAIAGEAGVPFFSLAGSDFVETFVGVGASRIRSVFDRARKQGGAIIFIDEIDAVGKARSAGPSNGSTDEREGTLNALLVEMDGFTGSGVVVLAATNRADTLDPALLRPGRFDRRITVPSPDRGGRERILRLHVTSRRVAPEVDLAGLARRTSGMTGADLEQLVNEAALQAARERCSAVTDAHLDAALQVSMLGRARRSATVTDRDRRITAWHEAGHTLAALKLEAAGDPVSVTIVPRGVAGGATWMDGTEDSFLTRSEAEASLVVKMSGRTAEEHLLDGDHTTGAAGDFQAATTLATRMVVHYGMSDLGVAFRQPERLEGSEAERVAGAVDRILDRALMASRDLLAEHGDLLDAIAEALLEEETLALTDLRRLEASTTASPT